MPRRIAVLAALAAGVVLLGGAGDLGWLAICSKCASPTIFSKTGAGTANAVAQARMTREELADWCANWNPDSKDCMKQQLAEYDLNKVYTAKADCTRGRITPIDGATYTYAGVWDASDIGEGRSKWKDASGQIVGRDNASGGLGISQQWEELCPKGLVRASAPAPAAAPKPAAQSVAPPPRAAAAPSGAFRAGQAVEAQYGRAWVKGRITRVIQMNPNSPVEYEVFLDNGQRGILPARMIRPAG
jgi:hypothetical protein